MKEILDNSDPKLYCYEQKLCAQILRYARQEGGFKCKKTKISYICYVLDF